MQGFSQELGHGKNYICNLKNNSNIPDSMEKVICILLGKEAGYFQVEPKQEKKNTEEIPSILINLYKEMQELKSCLEEILQMQNRIFNKCNANTKQLEDVKQSIRTLSKTDYDKACDFLQDALSGGRINGNDLLMRAEAAGLKRSEIMKARKDLNVQITSSGQGKNQKSWWYIPA